MAEPAAVRDRAAGATATRPRVWVVNTLGAALHHYGAELTDVLRAAGAVPTVVTIAEPSSTGSGRRAWLVAYLGALRGVRRRWRPGDRVIVTWPVLGYLDVPLVALVLGHPASVILHDTRPLTAPVGYRRGVQRFAAWWRNRVEVVVHSEEARVDIRSARLARDAVLLPHPGLAPTPILPAHRGRPVVRVLGQYKRDRDLDGLRHLAAVLGDRYRLEIVGRRWPEVAGWAVRDAFVPEAELDQLITGSDAVIIPYRRFYQSGMAIRALEHGVPVVGPAASSLATLCGPDSRLLVGPDGWAEAVRYAVSRAGRAETRQLAHRWRQLAVAGWSQWVQGTDEQEA